MRRSPSRNSNTSSDATDGSTAGIGGTYEPLTVNGHETKQPTYQPLTREHSGQRTSMYEDLSSKPPPKEPNNSAGGYASLGQRDESKAPYMTVNHSTT